MLKLSTLHPEILAALGRAGHLAKVLISDGNYPHNTKPNPRASIVWANFVPGILDACTILKIVADLVPIEKVEVMAPQRTGAYAMAHDPPIWNAFRRILKERSDFSGELTQLDKPEFNAVARQEDLCLVIATAETEIFANVMVTIGVVRGDEINAER
jgi:L-fucose mutarotase